MQLFAGDTKAVIPARLEMSTLEDRVVPARPLPYPVIHLGAGAITIHFASFHEAPTR